MNKKQELRIRLDLVMPVRWMVDNYNADSEEIKEILSKVVELNPEWVNEVVEQRNDYKLSDVLHDFHGIYSEDEHFLPRIQPATPEAPAQDDKVNGYTNIQTYRLCLVLDNEQMIGFDPLERFLELVSSEEFESTDINIINWNEVIERYTDRIVSGYSYRE